MSARTTADIAARIAADNGWYTGSQLEWSFGPARHVHALRERFLRRAVSRARARFAGERLRIVEAGCGDGVNLYRLRDVPDADLWGCDYNPLRLERARQLVPQGSFSAADLSRGEACPAPGGAHLLIFSHVLEHLRDDLAALRALRGWLAPSGLCVLMTPNEGCLFARLRNRVLDPWILSETDHVQFYTKRSLRRRVREAGFRPLLWRGEVLTFPKYRFHMGLLRRRWGYLLLRAAHFALPWQTSSHMLLMEAAP
jgi:SAM-dependent methyltransferase